MYKDKILLITGGTGSFGNAVLKKMLKTDIKEIRIFSRDEKKQDDMRRHYNDSRIKYYIGDVRDINSINTALVNVNYVFHAAALKQVPSCEFFPIEAVKTNVMGTENLLSSAISANVEKVICLSTDKAAYPVNAMGISKAMMEKVFVAKSRTVNRGGTLICGTRYGNVMASRGSVIPLFIEQIKENKPLTITHEKMTRFIMSLDEAVELVEFAFERAFSGDIMVQKSPSAYVSDVAIALCNLFKVERNFSIIGTRHGEKLYEALLTKEEAAKAIDMGGFFRVPSDNRDLNYSKYLEDGSEKISLSDEYNSNNTKILNVREIEDKLLSLKYVQDELVKWNSR
ncbi:polysaccharide biosynthesis protein [Vibrio vulnificus]|uniref:polysaccharide biosynthesis protein n=1 Tax=Vibrio vulnificus TaxID=672 RepID=UPI0028959622|nr:polysaccharide biosynthesis protein [Vibrio vulnificus]ELH9600704.1 polysaccharide biosynthesis protein [Vibrio vulnificus]ELH9615162.1 polysaccharide biosynthesis protein [Vibrio vulnificus]